MLQKIKNYKTKYFSRKQKINTSDFKDSIILGKRLHALALKHFAWVYLAAISSVILISVLPYVSSKIQGDIIDVLMSVASGNAEVQILYKYFLIFMSITAFMSLLGIMNRILRSYTTRNFRIIFTDLVARKFSSINLQHYENPKLNDKFKRASENYHWIPNEFIWETFSIISDIAGLISGFLILFMFSPILILIVIITLIPTFISDYREAKEGWLVEEKESENFRQHWWIKFKLEDERALQEIWIFKIASYLADISDKIYKASMNQFAGLDKKYLKINIINSLISIVGFSIIMYFLFNSVIAGFISIGIFTFYLSTVRGFSSAMTSLMGNLSSMLGRVNYMRDIFAVLDLENEIINGEKLLVLDDENPPEIEFKDVWFKYPKSKRYIFKNLNLKIKSGENIAFVGKNGAGKTTFVKLLCRFYDVTKGQILLNGVDIKELNIDTWYDRMAFLSQDFVRYHFDVKTNIGLGKISEMDNLEKIKKAAIKSGADEFITKEFENGYNQVLSKKFTGGTEPSVGQWQKIALARAFFKDAPVLILDEPTSAIDPKSEYSIFNNIFAIDEKEKTDDKTILIISHRFSTVRNANRIIVLEGGEIVESGSHEELLKIGGIYKEAFDMQKKGYE